jgi:ribosomal protein S18 acetylase RimI-like enzyme
MRSRRPIASLLREATSADLQEAAAENHRAFLVAQAEAAGGKAHQYEDITYTDGGGESTGYVLFPRLEADRAGAQIDEIVRRYRQLQPAHLVGWWSLEPPVPADLNVRLLARGFQPGWRPCWMWLDLETIGEKPCLPPNIRIEMQRSSPTFEAPDLPYYDRASAAVIQRMAAQQPEHTWHFVAWRDREPVGQSVLHLTTGTLGSAGIYNVGVVPHARGQGIGKAVTLAACLHARTYGYRHALLNATGQRMYQQLGFQHIGDGWTWWFDAARTNRTPPAPLHVALAEAVGRGDVEELAALIRRERPALDVPHANGMRLFELAAHLQQHDTAALLVAEGASLLLLPAWDLGWRDKVVELLVVCPERANERLDERGTTPLHEAVVRDDPALVDVLLAASPDLRATDAVHHATALEWARFLGRAEIVRRIEHQRASTTGSGGDAALFDA